MHPPALEHVHSLRKDCLRGVVLTLLATCWTMGCATEPPDPRMLGPNDALFTATSDERSAALTVLDSLQQNTLPAAFDRLARYAFTHRVETVQRPPEGPITARRTEVLRFPPPDSTQRPLLVQADSAGSFDGGWLDALAPKGRDGLIDRAQYVLPDDPAYLEPRRREAFRYRLRPDTAFGERTVRVVEIRAQPGELGADQAIRHARLFVEPNTHELVGLYLVRTETSLLFREDSRMLARLRPAPDSGWVPDVTRLDARLDMPLRTARFFRLDASFSAYRPLP